MTYNVFIAGGTGGIGQAIARRFASHPIHKFNVLIISREAAKAREALSSFDRRDDWQKHSFIAGDIRSSDFWQELGASCGSKNGSKGSFRSTVVSQDGSESQDQIPMPTILVNAAGYFRPGSFARSEDHENFDVLNVNLLATMRACRYMAKPLRGSRSGRPSTAITPSIINISSALANIGGDGVATYATAKAGLLGLNRALAIEYGRLGLRVNTILPGFIDTEMIKAIDTSNVKIKIPLGRLGSPDEVADAAIFLALNNYANNCALTLDGGLSASGNLLS